MVELLASLTNDMKSIATFVLTMVYLFGAGYVIFGMFALSSAGSTQGGISQGVPPTRAMKGILIGSMMLAINSVMNMTSQTVFREDSRQMLDYEATGGGGFSATYSAILAFSFNAFWLIGLIAFFRGMLLLARMKEDRSTDSPGKKAVVYMTVGMLLMNLDNTIEGVAGSLAKSGSELGVEISESLISLIPPN